MLRSVLSLAAAAGLASAVTIAEINGAKYQSALNGTTVTGVQGLVTAKNAQGVFLRSTEPDDDERTSESVFLFNAAVRSLVQVGDIVTLDATVEEYR
jgi:predicted extracellular nuclease